MAEEPPARPNRWTGPPSTWRSYTKEDRDIVSSLDTIRSQDLSIHLYNAYALKSRVRANRKGKAKSTGGNESEFVPPDLWTAWPMPAEEVPRDPYLPNVGGRGSWRADEDMRPSANLEEALLATTTKIARERWRARKWEWSGSKNESGIRKEGIVENLSSEQEEGSEDEEISLERPMFSSQALDDVEDVSSSSDEDGKSDSGDEAEVERRPVPLADDDRARRILLPSIRHVISKADDLLEGLQKAREAYAGNWNKTAAGKTTTGEDTDAAAVTSRSRDRSVNRPRKKRARASSVNSEAPLMSTTSTSSRGRQKPKMKQLKLRDWSEVLGMAALTGWDPGVVQRAAERCSRLFGEDMLFRTFHEGEGTIKSCFTEQLANGQEPRSSGEEEDLGKTDTKPKSQLKREIRSSSPPIHDSVIRCPVRTCPSHQTSYARATYMYAHVREHHPDVDINALRKLEARRRGEKRGKHDRSSRQRSSSAAVGSSR